MSTPEPPAATSVETPSEPPRVEVSTSRSVQFLFCGNLIIGTLPSTMTAMTLRRHRSRAMGWTEADLDAQRAENERAEAAGEEARTVLPPDRIDEHALISVYTACVGLCSPDEPGKPLWRAHRHNPVAYGEAVLDWLLTEHPGQASDVLEDARETGRALYDAINGAYTGLFDQAAQAAGFTESQEATG